MSAALQLIFVTDTVVDHLLADDFPGLAPNREVPHKLVVQVALPEVVALTLAAIVMVVLLLRRWVYDELHLF